MAINHVRFVTDSHEVNVLKLAEGKWKIYIYTIHYSIKVFVAESSFILSYEECYAYIKRNFLDIKMEGAS